MMHRPYLLCTITYAHHLDEQNAASRTRKCDGCSIEVGNFEKLKFKLWEIQVGMTITRVFAVKIADSPSIHN